MGNLLALLLWTRVEPLGATRPIMQADFSIHLKAAADATQACLAEAMRPFGDLPIAQGMRHAVMEDEVLPAVERFAPEFLFISAGFDAHVADPLAGMNLTEDDFSWITQCLCELAAKHCKGRVVSCLEGGYDLEALAASAAAHVSILKEQNHG
jgi:hypothetical protein